jgi:hypothetical protein
LAAQIFLPFGAPQRAIRKAFLKNANFVCHVPYTIIEQHIYERRIADSFVAGTMMTPSFSIEEIIS